MRMYDDFLTAYEETKRDLFEMGQPVVVQSMQNKVGKIETIELVAYGFQVKAPWNSEAEFKYIRNAFDEAEAIRVCNYIEAEFAQRTAQEPSNPGFAYMSRPSTWEQFLVNGRFHYTYSERLVPQMARTIKELSDRPGTRQAIMTIHSNLNATPTLFDDAVELSADALRTGGAGRVPCSMYYQFIRRDNRLDMVYTMRSCDLLTHHPIDIMLAARMHLRMATVLDLTIGMLTYFTGSLHAYKEDLEKLGIF